MSSENGRWEATTIKNLEFGGEMRQISLARHILDSLAWVEIFIGLGLHFFWVLAKSFPFGSDNSLSAVIAMAPFAAIALISVLALNGRIQAGLVRLEKLFHATACLLQTILLFYAALWNPFNALEPLSAPMFLWSLAITFILAAGMATHLRRRGYERNGGINDSVQISLVFVLVLLLGAEWLGACSSWVTYFWTISILFHATHAFLRPTSPFLEIPRFKLADRFIATAELFALLSLFLLLQMRATFALACDGTLEPKFNVYLELFRSPGFLAGFILFLIATRFRISWTAQATLAILLVFCGRTDAFTAAAGFGYILPALFRTISLFGPIVFVFSSIITTIIWFLGLAGFALGGVVIFFNQSMDIIEHLLKWSSVAFGVFLCLEIIAFGIRKYRGVAEEELSPCKKALSPPPIVVVILFIILLGAAVAPSMTLLTKTAWPPFIMHRPPQMKVNEPMGVCHAGYSNSEEEYATLKALGVQSIRADFRWTEIEPEPGKWNFSNKDKYVDTAASHGVKIIAILDFDNNGAEQDPIGKTRESYIAPSDVPLFLEYVRQCVTHFKGRVYAWEIWNEPDIARFWDGSIEEFYSLAKQTAETVRQVDDSTPIIGTAMTSPMGLLTARGVEGLYTFGAQEKVQHPACHLYVTNPRNYYGEFQKIFGAARRFGHPGAPCITEMGVPDGGFYPWSAYGDGLAEHVIKSYAIATSLGVDTAVWYCYQDGELENLLKKPADSENFFGLIGPGGRWKPSAHAFSLFSQYCSHSVVRSDLVSTSGGLAARQLRSALYRRDNGESTLILWFEPMLRSAGSARIHLDLGELSEPPMMRDIASGAEKHYINDIEVSERPTFITFNANNPNDVVKIKATSSPVDSLWLISVAALSIAALGKAVISNNR
jgi:hypothetical protein